MPSKNAKHSSGTYTEGLMSDERRHRIAERKIHRIMSLACAYPKRFSGIDFVYKKSSRSGDAVEEFQGVLHDLIQRMRRVCYKTSQYDEKDMRLIVDFQKIFARVEKEYLEEMGLGPHKRTLPSGYKNYVCEAQLYVKVSIARAAEEFKRREEERSVHRMAQAIE
ncbi:MAG: hypothetical protein ABI397_00980 [Candidatus Saccharimonas sp.]